MSTKEARRLYVLEQLRDGNMSIADAALVLGLSIRQVKRLKKRFAVEGAAALIHRNRGRQPQHTITQEVRKLIVERAQQEYKETSCEHMAELMARIDGITVSAKSITRILKDVGIPLRFGHKPARRRRSRDRMPQIGLLVQLDASPYAWLEDRGPELHLHGAIDDATGRIFGLRFELQETTLGYLHVLRQMISTHGVPHSLYTDRRTVFFSPKAGKLTIEQELAGYTDTLTQFGYVLNDLAIRHIPASSPQAKGRIERLWGTLQARLVVELRVAGVNTPDAANDFLPTFQDWFNRRFAVEAADPISALQPPPDPETLWRVLTIRRDHRVASRGSTISYDGVTYKLASPTGTVSLKPKASVRVDTHLDGTLSAWHGDVFYELTPYEAKPKDPAPTETTVETTPSNARKQDKSHPWNQDVRRYMRRRGNASNLSADAETREFWADIMSQR